jgi:hypothetical protein
MRPRHFLRLVSIRLYRVVFKFKYYGNINIVNKGRSQKAKATSPTKASMLTAKLTIALVVVVVYAGSITAWVPTM